jgi:uncharacterized membrane protein
VSYLILKFLHLVGFILIGSGLVGVFVADLRSRQTRDVRLVAEACRYVAIFYDGVVVPGAVLAGLSGLALTLNLNLGFFQAPWLTGMWMLFVFEFVEGNTVTRIHFRRMLRLSRAALSDGAITTALRKEMERTLPTFTHYLDLPFFLMIVSLGGLRPSTWSYVAVGSLLALVVAVAFTATLPRICQWRSPYATP